MTGSAPGQHDGTRFQQRSRARTSVQLLLTVTALCWSASDARRTALSKHVFVNSYKYARASRAKLRYLPFFARSISEHYARPDVA